jgi:hypothetical protein
MSDSHHDKLRQVADDYEAGMLESILSVVHYDIRNAARADIQTLLDRAFEKGRASQSATATITRYLVRAGGECPQDWLCTDIPEVQAALCEALFGNPQDADPDEIGHYLAAIQTMPPEESRREWRFEDGWLEVLKLRCSDRTTEKP